jgi:signal transduction histidine kinase
MLRRRTGRSTVLSNFEEAPAGSPERARWHARAVVLVAVAAVYFAAGKFGLSLTFVHPSASAVWPPTGIALAVLLWHGYGVWPAILAGAFLVNVTTAGNAATSLAIAAGNTLEGLAGAWLVNRYAGGRDAFDRPQSVFLFIALAGLVGTAVSPTVGVTSLCVAGFAPWAAYGDVWLTWWLGDAGGAAVVAPALLLWFAKPRVGWSRAQWLEGAALLAAIALFGAIALGGLLLPPARAYPLAFLCLPLTMWAAFRFSQRETATVVLLLSGLAIWGTLRGSAPFVRGNSENESLLLLQLSMGIIAVSALALAAVVSERRRTLDALERHASELARSNRDLDQFAHVVSHDLKAPLRGIASLATWVADDCGDALSGESREHLSLLEQRAKRMSQMIDGVLTYSRVGRTQEVPERVDSRAVLEEVIDLLDPPPDVRVRLEGRLPVVRFERTQLLQVFQNLIGNAVVHLGKPSGVVVVSCRERAGEFEFSVRDDGVGIPEQQFERIFKLFQALNPEREGTGVGLAIVKKIVEMHGGSVSVESTVGAGTTFRISIPKDPAHTWK